MNKDVYRSAMSKLKAGKGFYEKLESSIKQTTRKNTKLISFRLVPALIIICLVLYLGSTQLTTLINKQSGYDKNNGILQNEFEIVGNYNVEASYIAVVYIHGFAYEPIEWLHYSLRLSDDTDYESLKGKKLGEVTLDLKGKKYKGTPPDFSSTYDVGTEIYEIKNLDPKSAVLVNFGGNYDIFYRSAKHVSSIDEPIGLSISEVFNMLSDNPDIVSIELRNEENGSWMATSEDKYLIELANEELPSHDLLNYGEIDEMSLHNRTYRIPVNLIFADGMALNMQVYPEIGMAYTFGGFIPVSDEICNAFKTLYKQGSSYPLFSDLIPYQEEQITYLYLKNHKNGDEVICKEPLWSASGLYQILSYYRVEQTEAGDILPVMTATLGKSETDCITITFYETAEKKIIAEIKGDFYMPVRGQLLFESLDSYLYNNTDLGI